MLTSGKYLRKIQPVLGYGLYQVLPSLVNLIISLGVIRNTGSAEWGRVVEWQLYFYFVTTLVIFGNKEYLIREFSKDPKNSRVLWQNSINLRAVYLLLPVLVISVFVYPVSISLHLTFWIFCKFLIQSFESTITYEKKFGVAIFSEIIIVFGASILFFSNWMVFDGSHVLWFLSIAQAIRCLILSIAYHRLFVGFKITLKPILNLAPALPFMLLGMSGFLQLKSDMYGMMFFTNKGNVGNYQVFISYVSLCLMLPGLISSPFVKNIYRMDKHSKSKISVKLAMIGFSLGVTGTLVIYLLMEFIYHLQFPLPIYFLAVSYIVTPYFFIMPILELYKHNEQRFVMVISFISVGLTLILCYFLIPKFSGVGAMLANVCAQLFLWLMYVTKWKQLKTIREAV